MPKQRIKVQLDPDMVRWLQREAERRRVSVSQLIREMVLDAMRKEERKP